MMRLLPDDKSNLDYWFDPDGNLVASVNFVRDDTGPVIHLCLPFDDQPTLEFTLAELVDDELSFGSSCSVDDLSFVDEHEAIRDELRRQADRLDKSISERRAKLIESGLPER